MSSLERQVHEFATKEAKTEGAVRDAKARVEEALRARDQALTRDSQNQKEIARLMDDRKKEAARRDAEVEEAIERTKSRCAVQFKALEAELAGVLEKNSALRVSGEKASRECRSVKEAMQRSSASYEEERRAVEAAMKELEEKVATTVHTREEEIRQRHHVQEQNTELRTGVDSLRAQIEAARVQTEALRGQHESELAEFRTVNRELNKEVGDKTRQLSRRTKEYEELKASADARGQDSTRELEEVVQGLRRRLVEHEKTQYEAESARVQEGIAHTAFVADLKGRAAQTTSQLDAKCKDLKIESDRLGFKLRESETQIRQLNEDKYGSYNTITQLKSKLVKCQEDLLEAHNQLSDVNIQVAHQLDDRVASVGGAGASPNVGEDSFSYDEY